MYGTSEAKTYLRRAFLAWVTFGAAFWTTQNADRFGLGTTLHLPVRFLAEGTFLMASVFTFIAVLDRLMARDGVY